MPTHGDDDKTIIELKNEMRGLVQLQRPNSILLWHITLQFDFIYTLFYCIAMISLHFYKGYGGLIYPPWVWLMELLAFLMFLAIQMIRIYFGFDANRWESSFDSLLFFGLTFFSLLTVAYFAFSITYILKCELLFSVMLCALCLVEFVLSGFAWRIFKKSTH